MQKFYETKRAHWLCHFTFLGVWLAIGLVGDLFLFAQTPGSIKWQFSTGGAINSAPALAQDGTIYIGSQDHFLYAINPNGTSKWTYRTGNAIWGSPVIGSDGTVYVASSDSQLYAVNPNGTLKWKQVVGSLYGSTPAIAGDGTVLLQSQLYLHAFDSSGKSKWSYAAFGFFSEPAFGPDGTIYLAAYDNPFLYALQSDGTFKWSYRLNEITSSGVASAPAIGADGTIYFGGKDNNLHAVRPDGLLKWKINLGSWVEGSPAIGVDGTIYVGSNVGSFFAINPTGTQKWSIRMDVFFSTPTIGSDGKIYVGCNSKLYAFSPNGIEDWNADINYHPFRPPTGPAIAPDGTVYVGTQDGKLYAIHSASRGLANSNWPKFNRDNQNTGNAFNPQAPVAKVKQSIIYAEVGETVMLDGSPSTGNPLSFQWKNTLKPDWSNVTITNANQSIAQVKMPDRGLFEFQLTVTGNNNFISVALVKVSCGYREFVPPRHINSNPALGLDETIYVTAADSSLYAINPDMSMRWKFKTDEDLFHPSVGKDGMIIVVGGARKFYAIDTNGTLKWSFTVSRPTPVNKAIDSDGTIYVGVENSLLALNPNGTLKWAFSTKENAITTSPIIGSDGTIFVGTSSRESFLYAISREGKFLWATPANGSPAFAPDGTIYLGAGTDLSAFNIDGTKKWSLQLGRVGGQPIIAMDGTIYCSGDKLYAITPEGKIKSEYVIDHGAGASPALGADGSIYVTSESGRKVYALHPNGATQWLFPFGLSSPVIANDGTLYLSFNSLFAIKTSSLGLAASPWPTSGKDNQRTASVSNPNAPNAAVAKDTLRLAIGEAVVLDASASRDPDGDPLTYLWRCVKKPSEAIVAFSDSTQVVANATLSDLGLYRFSVTVRDNGDGVSVAFVDVYYGLKWIANTLAASNPALGADGTIYAWSRSSGLNAITPNGFQKWSTYVSDNYPSSPALGGDSVIYICANAELLAFDKNGARKWSRYLNGFGSTPAINVYGTVLVGSNQQVLAVNPDGGIKWSYGINSTIKSSPAIGADGKIFIGATDGKLYAITPHGRLAWAFQTGGEIDVPPAIDTDDTIFISARDRKLYAIQPNGKLKWSFVSGGEITSSATVGADGAIHFGANDNNLYALKADGSLKWRYATNGAISAAPLIGADGTIYFGSHDQHFYALAADGSLKWSATIDGKILFSPAIAADGSIYFGTEYGIFYAILSQSKGLADSAWPKFHHDAANTAAAPYFNAAPDIPQLRSTSSPLDNADTTLTIHWFCEDLDADSLSYQIKLWQKINGQLIDERTFAPLDTFHTFTGLKLKTAYAFLVIASDGKAATPSDTIHFTTKLSSPVEEDKRPPVITEFKLHDNYPNPFNAATTIQYDIPEKSDVIITFFNSAGQEIDRIVKKSVEPGTHAILWDASKLGSGIYFYRMQAGTYTATKKAVVLK